MLDIKYISEHPKLLKKTIKERNMKVALDTLLEAYAERKTLQHTLSSLRENRNGIAKQMQAKIHDAAREDLMREGKILREKIATTESSITTLSSTIKEILLTVPNLHHPDIPIGLGEESSRQLHQWGKIPSFSYAPKHHLELALALDLVDFERAAQLAAPKFYYLKNQAVILELALIRYALDIASQQGFSLMSTPDLAKTAVLEGIGFNPRGAESNVYRLEGEDLCLLGTAEISLGGYYQQHIFDAKDLPLRLAGYSHCFRKEAGAAGQYAKGLYRVHQFSKVELFSYTTPEHSEKELSHILSVEEALFQGLKLPYRVVDCATGDLGAPAYRKLDIEAWMPGRGAQGAWGEVTSASNCTDYQARRLNIRYRDTSKEKKSLHFVHTLNGTAIATTRAMVSIFENFQNEDGSIQIPEVLHPYTGFKVISHA